MSFNCNDLLAGQKTQGTIGLPVLVVAHSELSMPVVSGRKNFSSLKQHQCVITAGRNSCDLAWVNYT